MPPEPFLKLQGLRKSYGSQEVLSPFDLSIRKGELLVLLGPSGCGKTTLLRILAGLLEPDGGFLACQGKDLTRRPAALRGAPMVFQEHRLFPHMTVLDNVLFGCKMRGPQGPDDKARACQRLAEVGLAGLDGRFPAQLSGGQQQRVALVRALLAEPRYLLLDEPFSQLDPSLRLELRELLRRLRRHQPVTTILVTHDREEAIDLADRIAVMEHGRLLQVDTPLNLWNRPACLAVARLLGNANELPGTVEDGIFRTPGVEFPCPRPDGPAVALIRAEACRFSPEGYPITVDSTRFLGTSFLHRVRLGPHVLEVRTPSETTLSGVTWDPEAVCWVDP